MVYQLWAGYSNALLFIVCGFCHICVDEVTLICKGYRFEETLFVMNVFTSFWHLCRNRTCEKKNVGGTVLFRLKVQNVGHCFAFVMAMLTL